MRRDNSILLNAFPASLRDEALELISVLPEADLSPLSFSADIGEETVAIPYRIYHDPALIDSACLTRPKTNYLHVC
jgi:hypothetical protein